MNTTQDYLDAVKAKTGATSDYQLAKIIGVRPQTISSLRVGRTHLGNENAIKVAEILDIDSGIVLSAVNAERAKNDQEKAAWASIWEKLGGVAAGLIVALALGSSPAPSYAETGVKSPTMYIM